MKTVVILGKASRAVAEVRKPLSEPLRRHTLEIWGANDFPTRVPEGWAFDAWHRWFDVHTIGHITKHRPEAWEWYRTQDGARPIYLHAAHPEIPGSVAYPREVIQAAFAWGGQPEEFFTGSVDWMLALAIYEGVDRIELYGVDLWEAPHERGHQRNGIHYWIGIARGRGIDVAIPDDSSICKTDRLYGYFTLTSARNFSSSNVARFFAQLRAAREMEQPGFVPAGVDEEAVHG